MIIAAHIPVNPAQTLDPASGNFSLFAAPSLVTDAQVLELLHRFPNLILWISGHRHVNVVTPQPFNAKDPSVEPERNFWEVETASLRDFPQHLRTFDIRRNADGTISIVVTNVIGGGTGFAGRPLAGLRGGRLPDLRRYVAEHR